MKGIIVKCLAELVNEKFGHEKLVEAYNDAGVDAKKIFLVTEDVDDALVLKVVGAVCKVLNITLPQAADAFGDYWVNSFAPKIYSIYYKNVNSTKEFLLKMDEVHQKATKNLPNARPPRFSYKWENEKTLIMGYRSHRNLIDFLVGLARGVGKYYKENIKVTKLNEKEIKIVFP